MNLPKHLLPTTVVGSYPQPEWLVDRAMLSKSVPRTRMHAMWRLPAEHLEEAQDDATIVAMQRDPLTGALSNPTFAFDVGSQSSLGDIAAMRVFDKDLLFFTDKETFDGTPRGLFSAEINADGSLTILSERIDTLGVGPNDIALWNAGLGGEPCVADLDNGSGTGTPDNAVDINDLLYFLAHFEAGC